MRKRIVLAHPSYGHLCPYIEKNLRTNIMEASRENEWVGDVSTIRQGWVAGRNTVAREAAEAGDVDAVVWIDDDVLLPLGAISRLLRNDVDFITGLLFQKFPPYYPLISGWNEEKQGFSPFEKWPDNTLLPIGGCGFGIVVTSTDLLRKVLATRPEGGGAFDQIPGPRGVDFSEDFSFCIRAKQVGVQLWCDTAVQASHQIGPSYATIENHRSAAASRLEELPNGNIQA